MIIENSNGFQGQLVGPFEAGDGLFKYIQEQASVDFDFVSHLGIQTKVGSSVFINGEEFEIGKTGIYEIWDARITSISFAQDVDKNTIVDYTIEAY